MTRGDDNQTDADTALLLGCQPSGDGEEVELHATSVAVISDDGAPQAVLLCGPPRAGKSEIGLALIALGGALIADDRVALRRNTEGALMSRATHAHTQTGLKDVIETRGLGLLRLPTIDEAPVSLICRLSGANSERETDESRLPRQRAVKVVGCTLPMIETRYSRALADGLYCLLRCGALIDPDRPPQDAEEPQR